MAHHKVSGGMQHVRIAYLFLFFLQKMIESGTNCNLYTFRFVFQILITYIYIAYVYSSYNFEASTRYL
jgi:hypothetical protein